MTRVTVESARDDDGREHWFVDRDGDWIAGPFGTREEAATAADNLTPVVHTLTAELAEADARREAAVDAAVMRRLATDKAYRNAESADEQAAREEEITEEELRAYAAREVTRIAREAAERLGR